MKRHAHGRSAGHEPVRLGLTAMIDVVFLLLIFFVATIRPQDIMAALAVNRPALAPGPRPPGPLPLLVVSVYPDRLTLNQRRVTPASLDGLLGTLAALDERQPVVVRCHPASSHGDLVGVLDLCGRHSLTNLSVLSLKGSP